MKMYKHTPTSCSAVRSSYGVSRERTLSSSVPHSFRLLEEAETMFEAVSPTSSWKPIAKMSGGV